MKHNRNLIIFVLILSSFLGACRKDLSCLNVSSNNSLSVSSLNQKGGWNFKKMTHQEFKDAEHQAYLKMIKKLWDKKCSKGTFTRSEIASDSPLPEDGQNFLGFSYYRPAPPINYDTLPVEEILPFLDEEIAYEYVRETNPLVIDYAYSTLNIDLTSQEWYGSDTVPDISRLGCLIESLNDFDSRGYCLDTIAMNLCDGPRLKDLTLDEIAFCAAEAAGIPIYLIEKGGEITAALIAKYGAKFLGKTLVKAIPVVGAVVTVLIYRACIRNETAD